jgi:hypothetical protein
MLICVDEMIKTGLTGFVDEIRTGSTSTRCNANTRQQAEKPIFVGLSH